MGLFQSLGRWAKRLRVRQDAAHFGAGLRRTRQFQLVDERQMLSSVPLLDAIQVGATYVEGDTGTDAAGDTFEINFVGGGPSTQLNRVIISGDKAFSYDQFLQNPQAAALKNLDVFFDTVEGGAGDNLGKDHASPPAITVNGAQGIDSYQFSVVDGTSLLVIDFTGFDAGEKFVFTVDVDQVIDLSENPVTEGLDAVTSGVEFQNSTFVAEFSAPNFKDAYGVGKFRDAYDRLLAGKNLNLTPDNGPVNGQAIRDRSAGVGLSVQQTPKPITIAGAVFHDRDMDLVRDASANPALDEHGIDGVTLNLWKLNETTQQYEFTGHTTVTANGGKYLFGADLNLTPGTFQVREGEAADYFDVGAIPGTVQGAGVGSIGASDPKNVLTAIFIPLGDQHAVNYDFAEAKLAQISGYVYHDVDNDGNFEPNDPTKPEIGLGGIRMLIQPMDWPLPGQGTPPTPPDFGPGGGRVTGIVTTNPDGSYTFTGMRPGQYRIIQLDQHPDYSDGKETAGTVDGVAVGNAINPLAPGRIDAITLASGSAGIHYNFGEIIIPVSIRGNVHLTTRDGVCFGDDIQFVGVAGVRVELYDAQGNFLRFTLTDASGDYAFTDLAPGTYTIREFTPQHLRDGAQRAGDVSGVKTGAVTGTDATKGYDEVSGITLKSGQQGVKYDFCEHEPITIAGHVYHDRDNDGIFDTSESGIGGTTVQLWREVTDAGGNTTLTMIASQTTDAGGAYKFVEVPFTMDENGVQSRLLLREIQPGASDAAPQGWLDGKDTPGTGMLVDGLSLVSDEFVAIQAGYGDDGVNYNFGEILPVCISGFVYHDRDNDGVHGAGEEGIGGSTIEIVAVNPLLPQPNITLITNADGSYGVCGLSPGEYLVRQLAQPSPYLDGKDTAGYVGGEQRGNTLVNEQIRQITLGQGEKSVENNFGELLPASISGRVYISDPDGSCELPDGVAPERPLAGVRIELYRGAPIPANFVAFTTTNELGVYKFDGLPPGEYSVVEFTPAHLLDGGEIVGSHGGAVQSSAQRDSVMGGIVLGSGDAGVEYDFCEKEPAQIAGFVYHDRDNDGLKEAGEEGIGGVTMTLVDATAGAVVATTTTAADGSYLFDRLRKGSYKILEGDPGPQWIDGKDAAGTIARLGSSLVVGQGIERDTIQQIDIIYADVGVNYNFGEVLPASLQGYVFWDIVENCELPPGTLPQNPLANVTIELRNAAGQVIATTLTDETGSYRFDNLAPGTYTVHEIQPAAYFHDGQHHGYVLVDGNYLHGPGDDDTADVVSGIAIASGQKLVHYDFCEEPPSSISGYVFQDGAAILRNPGSAPITADEIAALRDGVLTPDDTRIAGVTLELRHTFGGAPVMGSEALSGFYGSGPIRTTTDASGFYQFNGLRAGNYTVVEVHPGGYIDSLDTAGTRNGVLNGIAVNRASDISPALFSSWSANPPLDTIAFIGLPPGTHAVQNNFSEVRIFTVPIPPETPVPVPPKPLVVAPPYIPPPTLPPPPPPLAIDPPEVLRGPPVMGYTWHLSVVDGGQPRELSQTGNAEIFVNASAAAANAWTGRTLDAGLWKFNGGRETTFGLADGTPVAGDFNGDGVDEVGIYYAGEWFIDVNGNGTWDPDDLWAKLGDEKDRPATGDWDGDGKDDIGIFGPIWPRDPLAIRHEPGLPDPANPHSDKPKNVPPELREATKGSRLLQRTMQGHARHDLIDHVFYYGQAGDAPIAGDWNGDGIAQIGVYRRGQWQLDTNGDGRFTRDDALVTFGQEGDRPVVGDWTGTGVDRIGVYRHGTWILDINGNRELDAADRVFELGGESDIPVVGDWDGDGADEPALYRPQTPTRVARAQ